MFMEQQLPHWYPELTRVTGQKDHDHIDNTGRLFDQKTFTARGVTCLPSNQQGKGRTFNEEAAYEKANKLIYIITDWRTDWTKENLTRRINLSDNRLAHRLDEKSQFGSRRRCTDWTESHVLALAVA